MSYGGADLSTVNPNPTLYSYGEDSMASDISTAINTAGQWGATIASVVTGNPVASVSTPNGVQTIGAAGSTYMAPTGFSGSSGILLLLAVVVVVILLVRE